MRVRLENLTKRYGDLTVLDRVSLEIAEGEIVSLIGPSGSGKTTLLRCLDLLERADQGRLTLNDASIDLAHPPRREALQFRRRIGFVFQQFNLFSHRTVAQNIEDTLRYGHGWIRAAAAERALEVLERVDLLDKKDNYPMTLSGGQAQRGAIARAIAPSPGLLILDEPTSALDPELTLEVVDVIRSLAAEGATMLLVTHVLGLARELSDRILFLDEGRIVEQGTAVELLDRPRQERTRAFVERDLSGGRHP